jgi:hypothetical protein
MEHDVIITRKKILSEGAGSIWEGYKFVYWT